MMHAHMYYTRTFSIYSHFLEIKSTKIVANIYQYFTLYNIIISHQEDNFEKK